MVRWSPDFGRHASLGRMWTAPSVSASSTSSQVSHCSSANRIPNSAGSAKAGWTSGGAAARIRATSVGLQHRCQVVFGFSGLIPASGSASTILRVRAKFTSSRRETVSP
jgi:hypothetical protein